MNEAANAEQARQWGLCATCRHLVVIRSDRGSVFVQCGLAKVDPRFPRYPPLPVIACAGHIAMAGNDKIK
jgi:hypothetical protein